MAKSGAQRQREWRQRQKQKKICSYGGCGEPVKPPATLCADHLQQAREKRAGQVRQLRAEAEALRLENAELRGRIAELEAQHAEDGELARLRAELAQAREDLARVSEVVRWYVWKEQQDDAQPDGGSGGIPFGCG